MMDLLQAIKESSIPKTPAKSWEAASDDSADSADEGLGVCEMDHHRDSESSEGETESECTTEM